MAHYGREEIGMAIPDGSGYIGTLNMYHELHCIVSCPCVHLGLDSPAKKAFPEAYPPVYVPRLLFPEPYSTTERNEPSA